MLIRLLCVYRMTKYFRKILLWNSGRLLRKLKKNLRGLLFCRTLYIRYKNLRIFLTGAAYELHAPWLYVYATSSFYANLSISTAKKLFVQLHKFVRDLKWDFAVTPLLRRTRIILIYIHFTQFWENQILKFKVLYFFLSCTSCYSSYV